VRRTELACDVVTDPFVVPALMRRWISVKLWLGSHRESRPAGGAAKGGIIILGEREFSAGS